MKIDDLIDDLKLIRQTHGNIEVTCTGTSMPDSDGPFKDVFETTVENLIVNEKHPRHGKAVRLWL